MMAFFGSPLKLSPSSPKRRKETLNWEQCIICQCSNAEPVICMRDVGKDSFVRSVEEIRCILVFCRKCPQWTILYHVKLKLFTTVIAIEHIQVNKTAVFSKQIRYIFTSTEQVSTMSQTSVVTRSQYEPIKWDFCFIC